MIGRWMATVKNPPLLPVTNSHQDQRTIPVKIKRQKKQSWVTCKLDFWQNERNECHNPGKSLETILEIKKESINVGPDWCPK